MVFMPSSSISEGDIEAAVGDVDLVPQQETLSMILQSKWSWSALHMPHIQDASCTLQNMADRLGQHKTPAAASGPVMQDVSGHDEVRLLDACVPVLFPILSMCIDFAAGWSC